MTRAELVRFAIPILAAVGGFVLGFLITRRWHVPTPAQVADAVKILGGTGNVVVLAAVAGFLGILTTVGAGASVSILHEMITGHPLDPSAFWERVLDSLLFTVCAFAGVGGGVKVGQRATTKPDVIREEAKAEAEKVIAEAKADVVRRSGAFAAVVEPKYDPGA